MSMLVVAVAALGSAGAVGCSDDGTGAGGRDDGVSAQLSVVVTHPDHDTMEYQLTCNGREALVGGNRRQVNASEACGALRDQAVIDRLVTGVPTERLCAAVFGGPDVATISGVVDEVAVGTVVDRTNACMTEDWDELLADLLPPAREPSG